MGRPGKASEARRKAAGGRGQARADVPTQSLAPEVAFGHLGHEVSAVGEHIYKNGYLQTQRSFSGAKEQDL